MSGLRRKQKSAAAGGNQSNKRSKKAPLDLAWSNKEHDDEDIESEDDDRYVEDSGEEEEIEETVDAKRVRLARQYLQRLESTVSDEDSSSAEDDEDDEPETMREKIARKLQRDRLKREGILERNVAKNVGADVEWMHRQLATSSRDASAEQQAKAWVEAGNATYFRGHDLTPTCVALQADGERALSGSKDNSVILWDVQQARRISHIWPAWRKSKDTLEERGDGEALSVACSDDGRYAVVGRRDATVQIYDIRLSGKKSPSLVSSFEGHKGAVTSLCFRTQSNQLFSGSEDRCIRHYNLDEMTYLETLYGHQAGVTAIDCHRKERPISVGMDRTARGWKLAEDTHLIFRGGSKLAAADCVSCVKDNWFVTGHSDGNLCIWQTEKKKAIAAIDQAHGMDGLMGRGIVSVDGLKGSDMVATGSSEGYLRLWKLMMGDTRDERGIEPLSKIPVHGFVNGIAVGPKARFCVVAVGQEHRLGRWSRVARAKNRIGIIKLRRDDIGDDSDEDEPEIASNHRSDQSESESD